MILLPLAVICAMLLGSVFATPASVPVQEPVPVSTSTVHFDPKAQLVNLQTEMSEPMFKGTVSAIDPTALRVTILTDHGRLVPVTVGSCQTVHWLRIGDRVHLDVDAQGLVRILKQSGASPAATSDTPDVVPPAGRCPETST